MIEFDGYITGNSEKYFRKKNRQFGQKLCLGAVLLLLPAVIIWGVKLQNWLMLTLYGSLFVIIPLLTMIPQSKKEKLAHTPKNIRIDSECITCKTNKFVETKYIEDVKFVKDFGEFYQIVFPAGNISNNYICQKSLLTQGTLADFEALFSEKIVRDEDNQGTVL